MALEMPDAIPSQCHSLHNKHFWAFLVFKDITLPARSSKSVLKKNYLGSYFVLIGIACIILLVTRCFLVQGLYSTELELILILKKWFDYHL